MRCTRIRSFPSRHDPDPSPRYEDGPPRFAALLRSCVRGDQRLYYPLYGWVGAALEFAQGRDFGVVYQCGDCFCFERKSFFFFFFTRHSVRKERKS